MQETGALLQLRSNNNGLNLYQTFFDKAIVLNENVRQKTDAPYRRFLRAVRDGTVTEAQCSLINNRCLTLSAREADIDESGESPWMTCPRYFPLNVDVSRENNLRLSQEFNKDSIFNADPYFTRFIQQHQHVGREQEIPWSTVEPYLKKEKDCPHLALAVGAPVLITSNIDIPNGIINGAMGKLSSDL